MKITEIFPSQQFEGRETGQTTIFIRFDRCNMQPRCKWCDVNGYKAKSMRTSEVIKKIKKYKNIKHITFTGGEPGLYKKEIILIMKAFPKYKFSVETNGLILLSPFTFNSIACSPKKQNYNISNLKSYNCFDNVFFKFVVENEKDYKYWKDLIEVLELQKNKCYFMPEGTTSKKIIEGSKQLSKWCIEDGFNVSSRLQILLYGKKKGV